jgi:hypothetical protein
MLSAMRMHMLLSMRSSVYASRYWHEYVSLHAKLGICFALLACICFSPCEARYMLRAIGMNMFLSMRSSVYASRYWHEHASLQ